MTGLSGTAHVGEMEDRDYHADPCASPSLSSSLASVACNDSIAHLRLRHPKLGGKPRAPSTEMDEGDMLHSLILTGGTSQRVALIDELNPKTREPYANFQTKRARELRDEAIEAGKIPVLPHKMRIMRSAYSHIHEAMCAKGVGLTGVGMAEQVLIWEEKARNESVVQCRAKLDHVLDSLCSELKTCATAKPSRLEKVITDSGYDIQCAAYTSAIYHVFPEMKGRPVFRWIFVEKEPPWCVTVMWPSEAMLEIGRRKWRWAINRFAEALETGYWPDYTGKEEVTAFPGAFAMELCEREFPAEEDEGE